MSEGDLTFPLVVSSPVETPATCTCTIDVEELSSATIDDDENVVEGAETVEVVGGPTFLGFDFEPAAEVRREAAEWRLDMMALLWRD